MSSSECVNLDDYLLGWLPVEAASRFEAHLADCPDCRDECRRQQQVDQRLAAVARHSQPVPPALANRIERRIRSAAWRRRIQIGSGSTAAALVLAASLWLAVGHRGVNTPGDPLAQQKLESVPRREDHVESPLGHEQSVAPPVSVRCKDPSRAILIPVETESPNVTLVLVYPTIKLPRMADGPAND
jgi:anti-sigma factor RsiW